MDDFAALQAAVQSSIARSDFPAHIYDLATSEINALRLLPMQKTATLALSGGSVSLPADFMAVDNAYVDADPRTPLLPAIETTLDAHYRESGYPTHYATVNGEFRVNPVPDAAYNVILRYYGRLANFAIGTDTNAVLTTHPSLYLYAALKHVAAWDQDVELAQNYALLFETEKMRITKEDRMARHGQGLRMRPRAVA